MRLLLVLLCVAVMVLGAQMWGVQAQAAPKQIKCQNLFDYLTHDSRIGVETEFFKSSQPMVSNFSQFKPKACNVQCSPFMKSPRPGVKGRNCAYGNKNVDMKKCGYGSTTLCDIDYAEFRISSLSADRQEAGVAFIKSASADEDPGPEDLYVIKCHRVKRGGYRCTGTLEQGNR